MNVEKKGCCWCNICADFCIYGPHDIGAHCHNHTADEARDGLCDLYLPGAGYDSDESNEGE